MAGESARPWRPRACCARCWLRDGFRKDVEGDFAAVRNAIEAAISDRESSPAPAPAPAAAAAAAASSSLADELKKFAELRDSGVLSEAEFEEQKAKLLEGD